MAYLLRSGLLRSSPLRSSPLRSSCVLLCVYMQACVHVCVSVCACVRVCVLCACLPLRANTFYKQLRKSKSKMAQQIV